MADFFVSNESKIRPGVHQRYISEESAGDTSARDGYCAIAIRSTWGPLGEVTKHTKASSLRTMYGSDAYSDASTVEAAIAMFDGGATTVYVYRMGAGGSKGSLNISDGSTTLVQVDAKYPGSKPLKISVQPKLGDTTKKVFTVYDDVSEVESFQFTADSTNDADALVKAAAYSDYVSVEKKNDGSIPAVSVAKGALSGGSDPVVTTESYSQGWNALGMNSYNTIALDIDDDENLTLSYLLHEHISELAQTGKLSIGVVGEKTSVPFNKRKLDAASFNDAQIVFLGSGFQLSKNVVCDGALAICRVAGVIAATPANESITHKYIPGAVGMLEQFTNDQYEAAIESGVLLPSIGISENPWFDSGINTLTDLPEGKDAGWKKIRRTKTRFEIMDRIDRALAPVVGRINADVEGIANVIQVGQGITNDMMDERKLHTGAKFIEDPENPATSDSAWFLIDTVDMDSLEHIYLTYQFRNQNS